MFFSCDCVQTKSPSFTAVEVPLLLEFNMTTPFHSDTY